MSSFYELVELRKANECGTFLEKLRQLPPDKQRVAMNFIEDLHKNLQFQTPSILLKGCGLIWDLTLAKKI
jgi:hypothetical protein